MRNCAHRNGFKWAAGLMVVLTAAAFAADETEPGLVEEVFDLGAAVENFPEIAKDKKPEFPIVTPQVNVASTDDAWPGTNLTDHFFIRWTGKLHVAAAGKYTLFTESDDGSRVMVDGKQIVDNGGIHPMEEKSGEVELTAGDHEITIEFFENEGGAGCILSWQKEGGDKEVIPASALLHNKK